jgi:hypothetical protein
VLVEAHEVIAAFQAMIRRKSLTDLQPWLERACTNLVASFVNGVIKDEAAVAAAITSGWSNGQTEGQITKLKLVKRKMYGRRKDRPASGSRNRASLNLPAPKLSQSPDWMPIKRPVCLPFGNPLPLADLVLHIRS